MKMAFYLTFILLDFWEGVGGFIGFMGGMLFLVILVSLFSKLFNTSVRYRGGTTITPESFDNLVSGIKEKSIKTYDLGKNAYKNINDSIKNIQTKRKNDKIQAIKELKELKDNGAINETEFEKLKNEILNN